MQVLVKDRDEIFIGNDAPDGYQSHRVLLFPQLKGDNMFDIRKIFITLGLPLGLVGVIVALLAWAGLTEEQLTAVAVGLVGFQLLGSFGIDALKYAGVINQGDAGKWSAIYNLVTLIGIAVWFKFFPTFDLQGLDAQVYELAKLLGLIFTYITQVLGTKGIHSIAKSRNVTFSYS